MFITFTKLFIIPFFYILLLLYKTGIDSIPVIFQNLEYFSKDGNITKECCKTLYSYI